MIDRKILEFIESLNEEEREELIKNLRDNKMTLYCDNAIMWNEEILSHINCVPIELEVNNGLTIKELVEKAHENAVNKGFWDNYKRALILNPYVEDEENNRIRLALVNEFLTLIASEVFEAQAELRKGNKEAFNEEIADIFIRAADLCGGLEIDIEEEIKKKMEKNKGREKMHGKLF